MTKRLTEPHKLILLGTIVIIPKGTIVTVVKTHEHDCEIEIRTGNGKVIAWIEHCNLVDVNYYHLVTVTVSKNGEVDIVKEFNKLDKIEHSLMPIRAADYSTTFHSWKTNVQL